MVFHNSFVCFVLASLVLQVKPLPISDNVIRTGYVPTLNYIDSQPPISYDKTQAGQDLNTQRSVINDFQKRQKVSYSSVLIAFLTTYSRRNIRNLKPRLQSSITNQNEASVSSSVSPLSFSVYQASLIHQTSWSKNVHVLFKKSRSYRVEIDLITPSMETHLAQTHWVKRYAKQRGARKQTIKLDPVANLSHGASTVSASWTTLGLSQAWNPYPNRERERNMFYFLKRTMSLYFFSFFLCWITGLGSCAASKTW